MKELMKNISKSEVLTLRDQVLCQPGQVVSKTLAQNDALSITLFAFDKDEEISTHASGGDAFVTCLEGVGKITIDGVDYELHEGESIVMPAGHRMRSTARSSSRCFSLWCFEDKIKMSAVINAADIFI